MNSIFLLFKINKYKKIWWRLVIRKKHEYYDDREDV